MSDDCNNSVLLLQRVKKTKHRILIMKSKIFALAALLAFSTVSAFSQEEKIDSLNVIDQRLTLVEDYVTNSKKLKISGYVQAEWQSAQLDSLSSIPQDLKVGSGLNTIEKNGGVSQINRMGVRRGRIKLAYEDYGCTGVLQFDLTEKGVSLKDAYLNVVDPWIGYFNLKGGVFDRPFGYEISYSSNKRESPERSRIFQTLFPDEREVGGMIAIQAPKGNPWAVLRLEAGLFNGNAIGPDIDSRKDFIGHLIYNNATPTLKYGFGVSYYNGGTAQLNRNIYSMDGDNFVTKTGDSTGYSKREYIGFDGQFNLASPLGVTSFRAEYIFGTQPGTSSSSTSPKYSSGVYSGAGTSVSDTYIRSFQGGYAMLVQDIADTKHSLVLKYDWYDPNTNVSGRKVGVSGSKTGKADMAYSTIGLGYLYRMNSNFRLSAYYDIVSNEKTAVKGYFQNVKDNLLTIRLQYKF